MKEQLISQWSFLLSSEEEARQLYDCHFKGLLLENIRDAVTQAALELVAIAKALPFDRQGRNKVAREAADQASNRSPRENRSATSQSSRPAKWNLCAEASKKGVASPARKKKYVGTYSNFQMSAPLE